MSLVLSELVLGDLEFLTEFLVCAAHCFGEIEGFLGCLESVESRSDVLVVVHFEEEGEGLLVLEPELELVLELHFVLEGSDGAHEDVGVSNHKVLHVHVCVSAVFL